MGDTNSIIINKFFEAYGKHDFAAIRQVMQEEVMWIFMGQHPLAGVKNGIEDVVAFFDNVSDIMGPSKVKAEKLVSGENDHFLIECQHITTHRDDGNNIDHHVCVLWTFEKGKIKEGRHFFADAHAADTFFAAVAPIAVE